MFTGLIQTTGICRGRTMNGEAGKLRIEPHRPFSGLTPGESIAVNGACLTLEQEYGGILSFHVMQETFDKTNLGSLAQGGTVNLERALALGDRLGGHLVSGHVDGTGKLLKIAHAGSDTELTVSLPENLQEYLVPKGSICLDGISLTIASLDQASFTVRIIPTTWRETALEFRKPGCELNLEGDLLGKYVRRQLENILGHGGGAHRAGSLSMDDLYRAGF